MIKKSYIFVILVVLLAVAVGYFYLSNFYFTEDKELKIYTADDFPMALDMMDNNVLEASLADLNKQYQKLEEGDEHVYIRWVNIGLLKKRLGDYRGAEVAWQNAASYNPDQSLAIGNLADLYLFFLKDYEKSEEHYMKALEIDPNFHGYYVGLASLYRYNMTEKADLIENLMLGGATVNLGEAEIYYMYLANYFNDEEEDNGGNDKAKAKDYTEKTLEIDPDLKDQLPGLPAIEL